MAAAFVQLKVESTDDFNADTSMVATYDSNPTVGNVSTAICAIANAGRTITGVTGCGTYATLETAAGAGSIPNAYVTARAAEVTSATAAQTFTASAASGSVADLAILIEASGIDVSNIESGTSTTSNETTSVTTHNIGSITPDTTETLFCIVRAFNANPGAITGDPTVGNGWTIVNTGDVTRFAAYKVVSGSSSAVSANITSGTARTSVGIFFALRGTSGTPAPTIVDVDEDNAVTLTQANISIDITDGDSATAEVRQGAFTYAMNVDSASATEVVADMPTVPGVAPKHGSASIAVINDDDQEDTQAITINADTATDFVDIVTPHADPEVRLGGTDEDIEAGDQIMWFNVVGGDETDVIVNDDATWEAAEGVTAFDYRIWNHDNSTWGTSATQTVNQFTTSGVGRKRDARRRGMLSVLGGRG